MMPTHNPERWVDGGTALGEAARNYETAPTEGARHRIWRRIAHERAQSRRGRFWMLCGAATAATAVAAALVVITVLTGPGAQQVGRLARLDGRVVIAHQGAEGSDMAESGQSVSAGSRVETGPGGRVLIEGRRRVRVVADESSEIVVGTLGEGTAVTLERGTVVVAVDGPKRKRPVRILAGSYEVRVVGTVFQVDRSRNRLSVRVVEGMVAVRGPDGDILMGSGQTFVSRDEPAGPIAYEAFAYMGVKVDGNALERLEMAGGKAISKIGEEAGAPKNDTGEDSVEAPEEQPLEPGSRWNGKGRRKKTRLGAHELLAKAERRSGDGPGSLKLARQRKAYNEALKIENSHKAIRAFDDIAEQGGPYAQVAEYRAARLSARIDADEAAERYQRLLLDHPGGNFTVEARLGLIEALFAAKKIGEARREIEKYLAFHSTGERAAEVRFLRAEIKRTYDKNCPGAIGDYEAAMGRGRRDEAARFWRAKCLEQTGEEKKAREAFERYLERYPKGRFAQAARDSID